MIPVLHLRSGHELYGADRMVLALCQATRAPFAPWVGSIGPMGHPLLASAAGVRGLEALSLRSTRRLDVACAREIAAAVRARRIELLHAHDFKSLGLAVLAARLTPVRVVATFHGDTGASAKLRAYEGIGRALGNATRGVAAVSRALQERLLRWVRVAPVTFIANGIVPARPIDDAERRAARMALGLDARPAIACIGRLSPEKGQAVLLRALTMMRTRVQVVLAGDGPDRAAIEHAAAALPVRVLGFRADTRALYAAADVIALPSLTEGMPLVALEAGLHHRPVVASRVGELASLLDAEALVAPDDAPALAHALDRLCTDATLRLNLADALRAKVEGCHSARAMADAYAERLYRPALARC